MLPQPLMSIDELNVIKEDQAINLLLFLSPLNAYRMTIWRSRTTRIMNLWDPSSRLHIIGVDCRDISRQYPLLSSTLAKGLLCVEMRYEFIPVIPGIMETLLDINKGKINCFVQSTGGMRVYRTLYREGGEIRYKVGTCTFMFHGVQDLTNSNTYVGKALKDNRLLLCPGEEYPENLKGIMTKLKPILPGD